jgi:hypothetical protein
MMKQLEPACKRRICMGDWVLTQGVECGRMIQYDSDGCSANWEGFVAKTGFSGPVLDFGDFGWSDCRGCAAG